MDRERWARLRKLFTAAGALPSGERRAWLVKECVDAPDLVDEVLDLLRAGTAAGSSIDEIVDEAAASFADTLPEGQRIGPYRILDTIGRGGMGQVYLAERADDEFRQRVAIKTVGWLGASAELVQRFRTERQILADLEHPHIARLLDGGQSENGTPYLVMEFVDGQTITEWCNRKKLSLRERLRLFLKVCNAVSYAHRKLVIHRDIKPSNILVDDRGDPKLLDFGIAKLLDADKDARPGVTRADMRVLTPEYASPEQVRGDAASTATDVYGLGILLYQLLTNRFPYEISDANSPDIAKIICNTEPTAPSTAVARAADGPHMPASVAKLARSLEGDLDNIIMKALRKEPERRYESVANLAADVGNYLERRPVSARKPSFRYRAGRFISRNRVAVATSTAVFLTVVAMTAWYTHRLGAERDIAEQERQTAEAATEFLIDLFAVNDPAESLGESLSAREVLDRGATKLDEGLTESPLVRARLLQTLGVVYEQLGLYDEAQRFLEEGAELNRKVLPRMNETQIAGLEKLAWIYYRREDWPRAAELAAEALALRESLVGTDDPSLGESINLLGTVSYWQDDFDATLAYYHRALEVLQGDEEWIVLERAQTLNHLGITYAYLGRSEEAEKSYLESLRLRLAILEPNHPRIGAAKANLAAFYHGINEFGKSRELALEALAIDRAVLGDNHADVAFDLNLLAAISVEMDELDDAVNYAGQAVSTWRATVGPTHSRYARALDVLATAQMERGDLDAALASAQECYDVILAANDPQHSLVSDALYTRGRVYLRRDEFELAKMDFERALAIREEQLGEDHPAYQSTLLLLAQAELGLGHLDEAEQSSRRALALVEASATDDPLRMRRALNVRQRVLIASGDEVSLKDVKSRLAALDTE